MGIVMLPGLPAKASLRLSLLRIVVFHNSTSFLLFLFV